MAFLDTVLVLVLAPLAHGQIVDRINTAGYPADFLWGAATAAYQVEGAFDEGTFTTKCCCVFELFRLYSFLYEVRLRLPP